MAISETWRSLPGYDAVYEVSSLGRVRSLPRKGSRGGLLATPIKKKGLRGVYRVVQLTYRGRCVPHLVHRLVAMAFVPNPEGHPLVLHNDGDSLHNHYRNLRWGTPKQNSEDAIRHGRGRGKLAPDEVEEILTLRGTTSQQELANRFGVSQAAISQLFRRNF